MLFLKKQTFSQLYYTLQASGYTDRNSTSHIHFSELDCPKFILNLWLSNGYLFFIPVNTMSRGRGTNSSFTNLKMAVFQDNPKHSYNMEMMPKSIDFILSTFKSLLHHKATMGLWTNCLSFQNLNFPIRRTGIRTVSTSVQKEGLNDTMCTKHSAGCWAHG